MAIGTYLGQDGGVKRDPAEVGALVKERREWVGLTQEGIPGVSSSTVRKVENGTADAFRRSSLVALLSALRWPADALEQLAAGADPATLADDYDPIRFSSADDVQFDALRREDPDGFRVVADMARTLLDRAAERRQGTR